jgi:uncharacterized protein YmfQ (DUF2313 family)
MSVDAFGRVLQQLLPAGAAWRCEGGSWLSKVLLGIGEEVARVDARGDALLEESDPRTALELLADWERVLGLPDDCQLTVPDAVGERQVQVAQKARALGGQSPQFYIDLARSLGYDITITEYAPLRAGFHAGDVCAGVAWAYVWQVNIPLVGITSFTAGVSTAGSRLRGWGSLDLECIIGRAAPAHTTVLFSYIAEES